LRKNTILSQWYPTIPGGLAKLTGILLAEWSANNIVDLKKGGSPG
jgi:hypothetical protein